jgi:hypothetical protein
VHLRFQAATGERAVAIRGEGKKRCVGLGEEVLAHVDDFPHFFISLFFKFQISNSDSNPCLNFFFFSNFNSQI